MALLETIFLIFPAGDHLLQQNNISLHVAQMIRNCPQKLSVDTHILDRPSYLSDVILIKNV